MNPQIATTPEQSVRLIACGVTPKSADMSVDKDTNKYYLQPYSERVDKTHEAPAWSLSALLELLPQVVFDDGDGYYLELSQCLPLTNDYAVLYTPTWHEGEDLVLMSDSSPIEVCVQVIEWLMANNYTLNNIKR